MHKIDSEIDSDILSETCVEVIHDLVEDIDFTLSEGNDGICNGAVQIIYEMPDGRQKLKPLVNNTNRMLQSEMITVDKNVKIIHGSIFKNFTKNKRVKNKIFQNKFNFSFGNKRTQIVKFRGRNKIEIIDLVNEDTYLCGKRCASKQKMTHKKIILNTTESFQDLNNQATGTNLKILNGNGAKKPWNRFKTINNYTLNVQKFLKRDIHKEKELRPIIIDGCNVACRHGGGEFSPRGLKISSEYFLARGHKEIFVILPQSCKYLFKSEEELAILNYLSENNFLYFIQSDIKDEEIYAPYDDWYIIQHAMNCGGVILTTDNYRDLYGMDTNPAYTQIIETRLLSFVWIFDNLIISAEPNGPGKESLNQFLMF